MKRKALIAAVLFVMLAGIAAGTIFYFKSTSASAVSDTDATTAATHGVPNYQQGASEATMARRHALHLVEQLGAVQDRIIRGERTALADQQRLLNDIAREVRNFGHEEWADYVNVRTSLLYVLSGGDAHVLQPLLAQNLLSLSDQQLASGIMSFAESQPKKARESFEDIDPRSLDVSLVGPFALAKASLYLEDDHDKAIRFLDDARLASPHTAIEEASARREIPLLLGKGNTERAMMLTTSYVREFGRSIYAWKLFREFAQAVSKREELDNAATVDRLASSFDAKDQQPASKLFVDLAGEGLLQGRLKLAKAASRKVLNIADTSPQDREKAQLYAAAADAPSTDAGNALKALDQITVDRLSEEDTEIREVAGFIAQRVVGVSPSAQNNLLSASDVGHSKDVGKAGEGPSAAKAMAALSKADAILRNADSIISGSGK